MNHRVASGILGAADGLVSISGVLAGGSASSTPSAKIAGIAIAGALAATVSMAGAELLSEDRTDWGAIGSMGSGTLLGAALPALPLVVLTGTAGWAGVVLTAVAVAAVVGEVRARVTSRPRWRAYLETLGILLAGGLVGYVAGRFA